MTSEPDNSGPPDAATDGRKQPAEGPVLNLRDIDDADRTDEAAAQAAPDQSIESSLVGDGNGLPAAERKPYDGDVSTTESVEESWVQEPQQPSELSDDQAIDAEPAGGDDEPVTGIPHLRADTTAPAATTVAQDRPGRGGFVPLVLGGVIAAALGGGAVWWALPRAPQGPDTAALVSQMQADSQATADAVRQDAVAAATEAARTELAAQAQALETRSAEAARDSASAATEAALKSAGASLADQGAALTAETTRAATQAATQAGAAAGADAARKLMAEAPADQLDANLQATLSAQASQLRTLDETVKTIQGDTTSTSADLKARLDDLAKQVADLAARPTIDPAQIQKLQTLAEGAQDTQARIEAAAKDAAQQLAAVREQAAQTQAAADEATRGARTAAAAATLAASLDRPVTASDRTAALAELEQAGVETPPALSAPVVPLDTLQAQYDDAARAGLDVALRSESSRGGIGNFFRVQTGARSIAPREGSDPDAVLSRAGDAVARGDIPTALSEIAALPEPAQQAMSDWTAKAQAWTDARSAVSGLTSPTTAAPAATKAATPAPQTPTAPAAPTN